jgi:hypothetical protein
LYDDLLLVSCDAIFIFVIIFWAKSSSFATYDENGDFVIEDIPLCDQSEQRHEQIVTDSNFSSSDATPSTSSLGLGSPNQPCACRASYPMRQQPPMSATARRSTSSRTPSSASFTPRPPSQASLARPRPCGGSPQTFGCASRYLPSLLRFVGPVPARMEPGFTVSGRGAGRPRRRARRPDPYPHPPPCGHGGSANKIFEEAEGSWRLSSRRARSGGERREVRRWRRRGTRCSDSVGEAAAARGVATGHSSRPWQVEKKSRGETPTKESNRAFSTYRWR